MSVNLLKPALRAQDIYEVARRQPQWFAPYDDGMAFPVWTSRKPARAHELINGGSVYWIVKNQIQLRQEILGIEEITEEGEKPSYLIMCAPELIRTQPMARRPFQGWRYLEPSNAPKDLGPVGEVDQTIDAALEKDLREAGLL